MSLNWIGPEPFNVAASTFCVIRNGFEQLEAFFVGAKNQVFHAWQGSPSGTAWAPAIPLSDVTAKTVAAGINQDGRLELFITDKNNRVFHLWQLLPVAAQSEVAWSAPTPILTTDGKKQMTAKQIVLGSNIDGRLEAFLIGTDGHLYHTWQTSPANVSVTTNLNSWNALAPFMSTGTRQASAKYIAVARTADSRLELFYCGTGNNYLYHNWQKQPADSNKTGTPLNSWAGETAFKSSGSNNKADQIAVASNADGRLELLYVGTDGHLFHNWQIQIPVFTNLKTVNSWAGENRLKTQHNITDVAAATNSSSIVEILYVGSDHQLYHNGQNGPSRLSNTGSLNSWAGESQYFSRGVKQLSLAQNSDALLDLLYIGTDGDLYRYIQFDFQNNELVDGSFGSNFNQVMSDNCANLTKVTVTIDVTQDIVCEVVSGVAVGFSFQLNACSSNESTISAQQYTLGLWGASYNGPASFVGGVDNWLRNPGKGAADPINDFFALAPMPSPVLPAGYQLKIILSNDASDNVAVATYVVIDDAGNMLASFSRTVLDSDPNLRSSLLAPIVAFELDFVGPINGERVILKSGAGTITYSADQSLTATSGLPKCVVDPGSFGTGEQSNSTYTSASLIPGTTLLQQSFGITTTRERAMMMTPVKNRHRVFASHADLAKFGIGKKRRP